MVTKIQQWGNSLGLRIPKSLASQLAIANGQQVELGIENDCLVVRPLKKEYRLSEMLAAITPENRHDEVDFGRAMGREIW